MIRLVLIRHAATRMNDMKRLQGRTDPPLSPRGRDQALALASDLDRLLGCEARIWTSDSRRARETADLALGGRIQRSDRRLREYHFGAFEGATYEENVRRHGLRFHRWIDDPARWPPPGGETLQDFQSRVERWLHDARVEGEVVAVTHGGVIRVILALLAGVAFQEAPPSIVETGTILDLREAGGLWRVRPGTGAVHDPAADGMPLHDFLSDPIVPTHTTEETTDEPT